MSTPLWTPSPERIAAANMTAFMRRVAAERKAVFADYGELYQWSIDRPPDFWAAVWEFCGVVSTRKWDAVAADYGKMPGTRWFPGMRLNFAENLLRWRDERPALISWNETGRQRVVTHSELYSQVARAARTLEAWGVRSGDRVAGFLPNLPETVVAMLAAASLGAIWSSTSPDFGLTGVLDRLGQIEPKVLFAADGYAYNGKVFDTLERTAEIAERLPTLERVVVVPYLDERPSLNGLSQAVLFPDFLGPAGDDEIAFEQLPFDHPLYILYSSGTTGPPKCIVHGAGGTLLQHLKELVLHTDLAREDRIFYFTTCGWMMWNWLTSSLAVGATVVLYDGSPFWPGPEALFDMAQKERITVFGTSARYLSAIEKAGVEPARSHDLKALRTILSTGSPLSAESFDYVYGKVKPDVCLSSISGGTDIVSCFALGNPIEPVNRGELQTRGLGMKVLVYDDEGRPIRGQKGELVCTAPFPSMPLGFWNDPTGVQYRAAYFDRFPGVWRHGDWVELTEHDGMIFYGRSDAVLNPGGVRIGTAEIYRAVEQLPEVLEAIAVGQEWEADVRVVLFVKLRPETRFDDALADRIKLPVTSRPK
jgi:acetoacetyl-CoA synthetase